MSKPIANPKLAALIAAHPEISMERDPIKELAHRCDRCTRQAIHLYTTGRKRCPNVRAKMAAIFNLTPAQLDHRLGLTNKERS